MSHSPLVLVLVVVLRSRLGIEAVCQDGTRMHGESKWREFRSYHRNADEDEDDWDMTLNGYEPWAGYASATSGMD
jgi:hypothetical protein